MPRRPRAMTSHQVFHILNRAVQGLTLFEWEGDYIRFLQLIVATMGRTPMRLLAYTVMPNHWHLVLWPDRDESLSEFMKWLTASHAQEWRRVTSTPGRGAVYQGRFKAIAVQQDAHFLRLCRYVERNAVRAKLVASAEEWPWTSAAVAPAASWRPVLTPWPVAKPGDWLDRLNTPEPREVLADLRKSIRLGRHYGSGSWRMLTSRRLNWRGGDRGPGRPWEISRRDDDGPMGMPGPITTS